MLMNVLVLDTDSTTWGNDLKLKRFTVNLNVKKNSFAHKVLNWWNSLDDNVLDSRLDLIDMPKDFILNMTPSVSPIQQFLFGNLLMQSKVSI